MKHYDITGMSCAACAARIEKAVKAVDGVSGCSVALLTNSMAVEGDASENAVIDAVKAAGYDAKPQGAAALKREKVRGGENTIQPLLKRLIASAVFMLPLMYISMGYVMWGLPLPAFLAQNPVSIGFLELMLSAAVIVINQRFFINGFKGFIHGAANMDTLVALGSGASFIYSLYNLFMMTASKTPNEFLHGFYFESAAMILILITFGKLLEAYSKGKTTDALDALIKLAPKRANIIRGSKEISIPIEEIAVGEVFTVRPGESVPADGIIIEGYAAIDESAITGESIPIDKKLGDSVTGATVNRSGFIKCTAQRVGEDTALSAIIRAVSDAAATKAPAAKLVDKISGIFVPSVMLISALTLIIWMIIAGDFEFALTRAISVLVISCPCALGLATPVAIMVGNGMGARQGILFKTAAALETAGKVKIAAFDKTGTITSGSPAVTDIIGDSELLTAAYSLEIKSEHPLSGAIVKKAQQTGLSAAPSENFERYIGGIGADIEGKRIYGGNEDFIRQYVNIDEDALSIAQRLSREGKTTMFFASDDRLLGIIAVADAIREDSRRSIEQLKGMGVRVVMLTGDNPLTAAAVAKNVGIEEFYAALLPEEKADIIRRLSLEGKTAMIGDGINDAPALGSADIGVALGTGTDIAALTADAVIIKSRLSDAVAALRLGRFTLKTIKQNLFWAFIYNAICIPIAAGALSFCGITLSPMLGAAAMSLSSFFVVTNALRLGLFDIRSSKHDKKIKRDKKEVRKMKKTVKIEGMMCMHCEARVKKILEEIEGVSEARVSHVSGTAELTLNFEVSDSAIKKAIEDNGYKIVE